MITAEEENARTLAAALGLGQEEATEFLSATALITAPAGNSLAWRVRRVLERTLKNVSDTPAAEPPAVEIIIGAHSPRTTGRVVSVGVDGYKLRVQDGVGAGGDESIPIVEEFAACYASAAAIRRAIDAEFQMPLRMPLEVDLEALLGADIECLSKPIELGVAHLAGAGAIGNGVLLGMAALDVVGELHVCDPDAVSSGNLNRTVWFTSADVGKNKAECLVAHAQGAVPGVRLVPHPCTLQDLEEAKRGGAWLERLIVAVDSRRARRSLQNQLPRDVFDASTTGISEIVIHFSRQPSDKACLSCVYFEAQDESGHEKHVADVLGVSVEDVKTNFISRGAAVLIGAKYAQPPEALEGMAYDSLFKALCSTGELIDSVSEQRVLAPFAFVSLLAGLWLVVEITRRLHTGIMTMPFNYWRLSPWGPPVPQLQEVRSKLGGCEFCGNAILQRTVHQLWNGARVSSTTPRPTAA